jgi:hypothetical protein
MFIFLGILFSILFLIVGAAATHGYAKHRWPSDTISSCSIRRCPQHSYSGTDDEDRRLLATWLWPFYWTFIWPFTKVNEITFSNIEKHAAKQIARNKVRIADLQATKAQVEASNAELEQSEVELEKELGKL